MRTRKRTKSDENDNQQQLNKITEEIWTESLNEVCTPEFFVASVSVKHDFLEVLEVTPVTETRKKEETQCYLCK